MQRRIHRTLRHITREMRLEWAKGKILRRSAPQGKIHVTEAEHKYPKHILKDGKKIIKNKDGAFVIVREDKAAKKNEETVKIDPQEHQTPDAHESFYRAQALALWQEQESQIDAWYRREEGLDEQYNEQYQLYLDSDHTDGDSVLQPEVTFGAKLRDYIQWFFDKLSYIRIDKYNKHLYYRALADFVAAFYHKLVTQGGITDESFLDWIDPLLKEEPEYREDFFYELLTAIDIYRDVEGPVTATLAEDLNRYATTRLGKCALQIIFEEMNYDESGYWEYYEQDYRDLLEKINDSFLTEDPVWKDLDPEVFNESTDLGRAALKKAEEEEEWRIAEAENKRLEKEREEARLEYENSRYEYDPWKDNKNYYQGNDDNYNPDDFDSGDYESIYGGSDETEYWEADDIETKRDWVDSGIHAYDSGYRHVHTGEEYWDSDDFQ